MTITLARLKADDESLTRAYRALYREKCRHLHVFRHNCSACDERGDQLDREEYVFCLRKLAFITALATAAKEVGSAERVWLDREWVTLTPGSVRIGNHDFTFEDLSSPIYRQLYLRVCDALVAENPERLSFIAVPEPNLDADGENTDHHAFMGDEATQLSA